MKERYITAACIEVPSPLVARLKIGGKLIAPLAEYGVQNLILFEKEEKKITRTVRCEVLYVSLKGKYGVKGSMKWPTKGF